MVDKENNPNVAGNFDRKRHILSESVMRAGGEHGLQPGIAAQLELRSDAELMHDAQVQKERDRELDSLDLVEGMWQRIDAMSPQERAMKERQRIADLDLWGPGGP